MARALLAERRRNLARERESFIDEGVIAALEAEGAQLDLDLAGVDNDTDTLGSSESEWRRAEEGLATARADFEATWGGGCPSPAVMLRRPGPSWVRCGAASTSRSGTPCASTSAAISWDSV